MIFYFAYLASFFLDREVSLKLFYIYLIFEDIVLIHLCFILVKIILKNKKYLFLDNIYNIYSLAYYFFNFFIH
jgi:hypothetical protein